MTIGRILLTMEGKDHSLSYCSRVLSTPGSLWLHSHLGSSNREGREYLIVLVQLWPFPHRVTSTNRSYSLKTKNLHFGKGLVRMSIICSLVKIVTSWILWYIILICLDLLCNIGFSDSRTPLFLSQYIIVVSSTCFKLHFCNFMSNSIVVNASLTSPWSMVKYTPKRFVQPVKECDALPSVKPTQNSVKLSIKGERNSTVKP